VIKKLSAFAAAEVGYSDKAVATKKEWFAFPASATDFIADRTEKWTI
jgi:hypothetical protein